MRKTVNIRAASTLRLFVPVRGRPAPEVKWGKADGEIKETALIDNTGSYALLVIENVDRFDSGKYTLTAENASGVKSAFISVRVLDSPSPPTNLTVKEITRNSVTLSWEPPLLDGGSKIKHYIVEKRESTRKVYSPITTCNKMSWKVESLPEGGIFFFRVLAENEYGVGLQAKTIEPIKISEKPQPPGKVSVVDVTHSTVTLTWEKSQYDGGSRISHYEVEIAPKDSETWSPCASVKGTETEVSNLLKGEEYQFRVIAVNEKGKSDPRQLVQSVVAKDLVIEPSVRPKVSSYSVQVGYDLKIEVPIAGHPKPTITWTKNGVALKQTTRVNVTDSAHQTTLTIKDATREDSGMYTINIANSLGSKDATIEVITLDKPGPPTGPVKIEDISAESMTLSWEAPTYTDTRWMKASFTNIIDTQFTITGLTEDCVYEFRVIAKNSAGISSRPSGSTGEITAKDAIEAPDATMDSKFKDLTVVHAGESFVIDADYTGKPLKEAGDDEWFVCTPPTGVQETHYTVKKLKENVEYNFRICAVNCEGVGDHVDLPVSVIAAEKLEAPEIELDADLRKMVNVRATATLRLFVTIRGKPEPEVKWSKADGTLNERAQIEVTSSYTMLVIENVDRFDTGKYTLTLENLSGSKSAFINVRVLDSPSAPTNLQVKDVKRHSVSLSWEPPLIDGGAKISHYIVEKREQKRMAFTSVSTNCVRNSYIISDLQEGGRYFFRVLAVNDLGVGLPATTDQVKVSEAPLPPGKVVVVDVTRHTVTLSWEKPDHDGGSKITSYIVEMQPKGDDKWTVCSEAKALEATIDGLIAGEEYSFRVIAVNDKGRSDAKPLATPVVVKDITMEPIINLLFNTYSINAGDDFKIDVPFKGRPQPEVSWKKDGQMLKQTTRVNVVNSKTSSKIVIKDATKEDVGKYEITLTNSVGTKTAEISVIVLDKPGPPSNIKMDEVSADFISLSWDPPTYDGGCQINNYVVEKRDTTSTTWQIVSATVARTSIKVSRLNQGTEYQFRIAAENRYGKSPAVNSAPVIAQYPFEPPSSPTNLHVAHATKTSMLVVWGRPASDGGSPVIGYHIECKDQSINRTVIRATHFKVTTINAGLIYEFKVAAENAAGLSAFSKVSDAVLAIDACGECKIQLLLNPEKQILVGKSTFIISSLFYSLEPPINLRISDITKNSISLAWEKPNYDGGSPITGYIIEKKEVVGAKWSKANLTNVSDTRFIVTGLTQNETYEFRVMAKNAVGSVSNPSMTAGPATCVDTYGRHFLPVLK
uniref:Titin n=1 Tax=Kryptolebias marmoratus TaxID=37003 RepID=A0A3Q3BI45_KRYMA